MTADLKQSDLELSDSEQSWIRRFHTPAHGVVRSGEKPLVVFLPHAGGSASYFHPLSAALADRCEAVCVQYPGRQDRRREPLIDSIPEIANQLVPVLEGLGSRPLILFGHSMGASVAFELARALAGEPDSGEQVRVAGLIVSARGAPSIVRNFGIHRLDDDGLVAEVRALAGTSAEVLVDDELIRMVLPAIRNDYRAAERYVWGGGPPIAVAIVGMTGQRDPRVRPEDLDGWAEHTDGGFDLTVLPGGHFYLTEQVERTASVIAGAVDRFMSGGR